MEKKYRLLKNYQFQKLINNSKYLVNREFLIYYFPNNKKTIRIGISVPKKRVKKAFMRNKIKRQIKSMLSDIKKDWPIDLVIIVKKNYLNNDYQTNKLSLNSILSKVPMKEENK